MGPNYLPGQYSVPILTQFLKINHISCCESFDVGTIFFLTNYTHSLNLHAEGRMHRV